MDEHLALKTMSEVRLVGVMGSDLTVVNAARVSFSKSSASLEEKDKRLIRYLAKHNHWTPFGHPHASFHIQAPIMVARQLARHQTGLVWNEMSRRYVDSDPYFFIPMVWRGRPPSSIKQGSGEPLGADAQRAADPVYIDALRGAYSAYKQMLELGVAPEQARAVLPLATFTEWIWTGSLYAFARVCQLRLPVDAQEETRRIAVAISENMMYHFPVSWDALMGEALSPRDGEVRSAPPGPSTPLRGRL